MLTPRFQSSVGQIQDFLRAMVSVFVLLGAVPMAWAAASIEDKTEELKDIKHNLKAAQATLDVLEDERDAERMQVREVENRQAEAARAAYEARFALTMKESELIRLREQQAGLDAEIASGLTSLEENVRALYLLGAANDLDGLLSPGSRADKMRIEGYLAQLRASRVEALQHLRVARAANRQVQSDIEFTLEESARLALLAESEQAALDKLRAEREVIVGKLDARLEVGEARVKQMARDQRGLERMLDTLAQAERAKEQAELDERKRQAQAAVEAKSKEADDARRASAEAERQLAAQKAREKEADEQQSAEDARVVQDAKQVDRDDEKPVRAAEISQAMSKDNGEIPVSGRKLRGYGDETGVGDLRSRGIFFVAAEGARVRALADGKVVFSDWVRGYGNLIIVQHAGGYLSLYAQNEALLKSTGARVKRGEVVATAGRSGGERKTGVYIEVRRNGRPMNPMRWSAWPKG